MGRTAGGSSSNPRSCSSWRIARVVSADPRPRALAASRRFCTAGYTDDGRPGPRRQYREDYYGAFLLDPDGNSIEAVHHGSVRRDHGVIDHLWIRVADLAAAKRFYETIAPYAALRVGDDAPESVQFAGEGASAL